MVSISNLILILLQSYFLLMNFTIERFYCLSDLGGEDDKRFLVPETVEFCSQNNPLFLAKPSWLHIATCVSAFLFPIGYFFILYVAATDSWGKVFAIAPVLLFVGVKSYAIYFYHLMEFLSDKPPQNLVAYFSVEGPYIVSLAMCLVKVMDGLNALTVTQASAATKSKAE